MQTIKKKDRPKWRSYRRKKGKDRAVLTGTSKEINIEAVAATPGPTKEEIS
jgi:hypothetical protein